MFRLLLISALFGSTFALTECSNGQGPALPFPLSCGSNVETDDGQCCLPQDVVQVADTTATDATTVAGSNTGSTVAGSGTTATVRSNTVSGTSVSGTGSGSCVDKLNPSTGVSDCPARVALCNDATYYTVMTQQCPKTCGRCNSTSSSSTSGSTASCQDLVNPSTGVSDCSSVSSLCNDANYYNIMTVQCPKTCGRCGSTGSSVSSATVSGGTTAGTCVDKINPSTGTSDCPNRVSLCTNSAYTTLMRDQCPKTCGFCSGSATGATVTVTGATAMATTAGTSCVDQINPNTGTSDCPAKKFLCTNSAYATLMRTQCPLTCGFCSG